ncbi:hypothetical protein BHAOGJBA_2475 [Methylobacterium hispanicum]|uniref:Uncharacterized protein n=1 Tax=Methylobacterium hispanicum TaxID=270350 RepID=A0AAV4ZMF9_9HYPH|nr:hypothetical protein BHAOGJBA_2475 [Methylobacterium hispanicum]
MRTGRSPRASPWCGEPSNANGAGLPAQPRALLPCPARRRAGRLDQAMRSRSFVSGMKIRPTTKVKSAITIGYQRP